MARERVVTLIGQREVLRRRSRVYRISEHITNGLIALLLVGALIGILTVL
jgi:F0F1-type ATP synthase assembly protein I